MAGVTWPAWSDSTGRWDSGGSWLMTELTFALISVIALSPS